MQLYIRKQNQIWTITDSVMSTTKHRNKRILTQTNTSNNVLLSWDLEDIKDFLIHNRF